MNTFFIFALAFCLFGKNYATEIIDKKIDPKNSIIWGPGLKPEDIVMKVRYIFLQLQDNSGKK